MGNDSGEAATLTPEHPNDEPFRPIRVVMSPAAQKLDTHLAQAIADFSPTTEAKPVMTTPAPGSFAASIRAMMDEARAGVERAKADGLNQVRVAVGKLGDAATTVTKVATNMATAAEDEAASVLSEMGQISNDI